MNAKLENVLLRNLTAKLTPIVNHKFTYLVYNIN